MKFIRKYLMLPFALIAVSAFFYLLEILLFHRSEETVFYMFQDISFVPVQVLLVTVILDRLLKKREKESLMNKLNMVIGVFYNDVGTRLLKLMGGFSANIADVNMQLDLSNAWTDKDFRIKMKEFNIRPEDIDLNRKGMEELKEFLESKTQGLLGMLANPNLLEHDSFTDLLWAVFHVADELAHRDGFHDLPATDLSHLKVDIIRAYKLVVYEWLSYMKHLKKNYPYLYSIAVRTNPFNPEAGITVM